MTALDEAPMTGDRVLLERLVANLLDNAERFNITGGTVSISTTTDNGSSLVRVVNADPVDHPTRSTGCSCRSRRLDDRTRHEGYGLGLALVPSIATVHSGNMHATAVSTGGVGPDPATIAACRPRCGHARMDTACVGEVNGAPVVAVISTVMRLT